ncbi:hypothetical protein niasHT_034617 [Heterodera trifolii]|uniref:Uncharacterized protein n=1 Tax=Heterodera trifolii TaxID=157864 RepID=A0ABD2IIU3_9BILA
MVRTRLQKTNKSKKTGGEAKSKRKGEKQMEEEENQEKESKEEKREQDQEMTSQETKDITILKTVSCTNLEEDGNQKEQKIELPNESVNVEKTPSSWGKIDFWGELEKTAETTEEDNRSGTAIFESLGNSAEQTSMETTIYHSAKESSEIGTDNGLLSKMAESPPKVPPLTPPSILRKVNSPGGNGVKKIRRVQFKEDELGPGRIRFGRSFSASPYPKRLLEHLDQSTSEGAASPSADNESPAKRPMKAFGQIWPIASAGRPSTTTPTRWSKSARRLLPIHERGSPCDVPESVQKAQSSDNKSDQSENNSNDKQQHVDEQLEKLPRMDEQQKDDEIVLVGPANVCVVLPEEAENEHNCQKTAEQPKEALENDIDKKVTDFQTMAETTEEDNRSGTAIFESLGNSVEQTSMETTIYHSAKESSEIGTDNGLLSKMAESPPKVPPLTPPSILRKVNSPGGNGVKKIRRVQFKEDELGPGRIRFGRSFSASPYPKRLLEHLDQSTSEGAASPSADNESPAKRPMKAFGQIWPIASAGRPSTTTPTRWSKSARRLLPIHERGSPCDAPESVQKAQSSDNKSDQSENNSSDKQHMDEQLEKLPRMDEQQKDDEIVLVGPANVCVVLPEEEANENKHQQKRDFEQPNEMISNDSDKTATDLGTVSNEFEENAVQSEATFHKKLATDSKSETFERIKNKLDEHQEKLRRQMEAVVEESTKRMLAIVAEELAIAEGLANAMPTNDGQ